MENRFFLTLEPMLLQIVEFGYTLCIVESENEEKKRTWGWNNEVCQWRFSGKNRKKIKIKIKKNKKSEEF